MLTEQVGSLRSQWTTAHECRIHAWVPTDGPAGAALPVVLIHGLAVSSRTLLPTAMRLAANRRVYAPDLPGFGRSTQPSKALTVPFVIGLPSFSPMPAFSAGVEQEPSRCPPCLSVESQTAQQHGVHR
ncbi:MAG TPA: alpha/beta fold hydrolase [Alphaproteobacteria bacterium]|nr:alpha/beta fold hydrolase [Alphaproteobacteria bacterium]